ncbi:uncharacterized protein [Aristolochia californica]|uniref:uncharacterized protein n=1 Tax=Aristolochia californica TaxID=171875 RepID=UPI0035E39EB1
MSSAPSTQFASHANMSYLDGPNDTHKWILDSGATHHMTPHLSLLHDCAQPSHPVNIQVANGSPMPLASVGTVTHPTWSLSDVFHVPHLAVNLLSIGKLTDLGLTITFASDHCLIQDSKSGKQIGIGHREGGLYLLDDLNFPVSLQFMITHNMLDSTINSSPLHDCVGCHLGKQCHLPFTLRHSVTSSPFDLVHFDVWGPTPVSSKGGAHYYALIVDALSPLLNGCMVFVLPMSTCVSLVVHALFYYPLPVALNCLKNLHYIPLSTPVLNDTKLLHIDPFVSDEPHDDQLIIHHQSTDSPLHPEIHSFVEPKSYKEAASDANWRQAINDELTALHQTGTWKLLPLPLGKHAIGYKWIFKVKTQSDGTLERYKARLVAKGFSQTEGFDYDETFAPVAQMKMIRTLISIASVQK